MEQKSLFLAKINSLPDLEFQEDEEDEILVVYISEETLEEKQVDFLEKNGILK